MGESVVDRIRHLLDEMDAEGMPNQRRAEILSIAVERVTRDDMAWALTQAAQLLRALDTEGGRALNQSRPLYDHDNRHNDQDQLDDQADGRIDTRQQADCVKR